MRIPADIGSLCTVVITANPIVDHPNITFIKETIESLDHLEHGDEMRVVLSHDGNEGNLITDSVYEQYFVNLREFLAQSNRDHEIIRLSKREYLTGNLKSAVREVDTPFVLNVQHDTPFIRKVRLAYVLEDMLEHEEMQHVRFNRRPNLEKGFDRRGPNRIWEEVRTERLTYVKTNGWSASNHVARVEYIRKILSECNKRSPEKFIMRMSENPPPWREWRGTFIYGGVGDPPSTCHKDARRLVDFWSLY